MVRIRWIARQLLSPLNSHLLPSPCFAYGRSPLHNGGLVEHLHDVVWEYPVSTVLSQGPCSLSAVQPMAVHIHKLCWPGCKFSPHRQWDWLEGTGHIGFKLILARWLWVSPVNTFCMSPTLLNEVQLTVKLWQKQHSVSTSPTECL